MNCAKCDGHIQLVYEEIRIKQSLKNHLLEERLAISISGWCGYCLRYAKHAELFDAINEGLEK